MKPENLAGVLGSRGLPVPPSRGKGLNLDLEAQGGAVVLHCQGRIIFGPEARALSDIVADVLPSSRRMIVDLAGIETVDSAGLGEFVLLHMWAEAAGYSLKFASPRQPVRRLLELTNLVAVFDAYGSVAEAMDAMLQEEVCSA
ncbi:MAG: STAS domain-containing protein [Acidobacteria bacterium]|nr:STAS domain-containing protein [Acidobacteriota bacterium]